MLRVVFFGFALLALNTFAMDSARAGDNDEEAAICAKAEGRYQEIFGDTRLPPNTVVVKLYKYTFCPVSLTVKPGTTVRWVNVDKRTSHSVWPKEAGIAESGRFFPDEFFEIKFDDEGEYPYLCGPHWEQEGMKATLKVVK